MVEHSFASLMEEARGAPSPTAQRVLGGVLITVLDMVVASDAKQSSVIRARKGAPISARLMAAANVAHGANQVRTMEPVTLLVTGLRGERLASVAFMLHWCKIVAFVEAAQWRPENQR